MPWAREALPAPNGLLSINDGDCGQGRLRWQGTGEDKGSREIETAEEKPS
jgi:hypothetical protein